MNCNELEHVLELQPDEALPDTAKAHLNSCVDCRTLVADLETIRAAAFELGSVEVAPPERIWVALQNQLEAEGLIRIDRARRDHETVRNSSWFTFPRPAFAGAFLVLMMIAAGWMGYRRTSAPTVRGAEQIVNPSMPDVRSVQAVFDQELTTVLNRTTPGIPPEDPIVAASLRRNLDIVDNFIALCEKSVREEPDNMIAREYLYGAYQQKAELLATAVSHSSRGEIK